MRYPWSSSPRRNVPIKAKNTTEYTARTTNPAFKRRKGVPELLEMEECSNMVQKVCVRKVCKRK
jgi:hypothetical protein